MGLTAAMDARDFSDAVYVTTTCTHVDSKRAALWTKISEISAVIVV